MEDTRGVVRLGMSRKYLLLCYYIKYSKVGNKVETRSSQSTFPSKMGHFLWVMQVTVKNPD